MAFLFAGKVWFDKQRCGGAAGLCPVEATAPTFCEVDSFASSPAAERTGVHERTCGTRIAALRPGAAAGFRSRSDRFYQQTFPPRPAAAGCPQAKSIPQGSAGRSLPPQPPPAEARCSRPKSARTAPRKPRPVPAAPKKYFSHPAFLFPFFMLPLRRRKVSAAGNPLGTKGNPVRIRNSTCCCKFLFSNTKRKEPQVSRKNHWPKGWEGARNGTSQKTCLSRTDVFQ